MAARRGKSASANGADAAVSAMNGAAVAPVAETVGRGASPLAQPLQAGRPKGSRNKLGEHFIAALCADFERHGVDVITRVREDDPAVYLRVIAQVVPQTVLMQDAKMDELSDDELAAYLFAVREALGGREGAGAASGDEQAEPVSLPSGAEDVS